MISEALELPVEGGRVSHSWCMVVVSHGYGGLGGGRDGGGGWYACGTCRMSGDAGALPVCEVIHLWLPVAQPSRCAALVVVELEFVVF